MNLEFLKIMNKTELCGNITSISGANSGIDKYIFGEYFYGKPLLRLLINRKNVRLLLREWTPYCIVEKYSGDSILEVRKTIYEDIVLFQCKVHGESSVNAEGEVRIYHYFSEKLLDRLRDLVNFSYRILPHGILFGYNDTAYLALVGDLNVEEISCNEVKCRYRLKLSPGNKLIKVVCVGGFNLKDTIDRGEEAYRNMYAFFKKRASLINSMLNKVKKVHLSDKLTKLYYYCWYVILSNRAKIPNHPLLKHPFNMPSKYIFLHQWLWDSGFHAIVLSRYDVEMAKEELLNLFISQKPDGRIPHEIFLSRKLCNAVWRIDDYVPWTTQPPVLAIAINEIYTLSKDVKFARKVLPKLIKYDKWFKAKRDYDDDELFSYVDYLESGWDDSIRWDDAVSRYRNNVEKYKAMYDRITMAPVEAIDLNVFMYIQRKTIAKLSEELGDTDTADEYLQLAEKTKNLIQKYMWCDEIGMFFDVYEEDHSKIYVKTPAGFYPMFAGIATEYQAKSLVEHLLNEKEFWTTFPLPSVSADNPKYDPEGYWRGRSWINPVWFVYKGLLRYGYRDAAKKLAEKVLDIMSEGPTCYENYNSLTGNPLGAPDFGWSTLIIDIILDEYGSQ